MIAVNGVALVLKSDRASVIHLWDIDTHTTRCGKRWESPYPMRWLGGFTLCRRCGCEQDFVEIRNMLSAQDQQRELQNERQHDRLLEYAIELRREFEGQVLPEFVEHLRRAGYSVQVKYDAHGCFTNVVVCRQSTIYPRKEFELAVTWNNSNVGAGGGMYINARYVTIQEETLTYER